MSGKSKDCVRDVLRILVCVCVLATQAVAGVFDLGDVIVREDRARETPVATERVLDARSLALSGARTVDEALMLVPGLSIMSPGNNIRHVGMRGFSQRDILVLVDGLTVGESYDRVPDLGRIPLEGLAEIRIVSGLPSVLYGPNSAGGVINIITRQAPEQRRIEAQMNVSDYGTLHAGASASETLGALHVMALYAWHCSDGFPVSGRLGPDDAVSGLQTPYQEEGGRRVNSDYRRHHVMAKAGYDTPEARFYLSFHGQDYQGGIPVELRRHWRYSHWRQGHLNLVGETLRGPLRLRLQGFYLRHDDTLEDDTGKTTAMGGRVWFDQSSYENYAAGARARADWSISDFMTWRGQISYRFDQNKQREFNPRAPDGSLRRSGWTDWARYETALWSAALEQEMTFDRLTTVAGLSYDLHEPLRSAEVPTGDRVGAYAPQVGAHVNLTPELAVRLAVGEKTRFPTMKELYNRHAGGNPDLVEERVRTMDAGVQFETRAAQRPLTLQAGTYYSRARDHIERVNTPEGGFRMENTGRAVMRGVELAAQLHPLDPLRLDLLYAWQDPRDKETHARLDYIPRHQLGAVLRLEMERGCTLFSRAEYRLGARERVVGRDGSSRVRELAEVVVWQVGIEQRLGAHLKLTAQVDNLLDENYDVGGGPMPGRRFWAGCRATW